jgi:serine/threonine protein kinase
VVDLGIPGYGEAEEIGRGGFATVYRARRERLGDLVAIKLIDTVPDERVLRRFERELQAMGKVAGHRNLVAVHDADRRADGRPYIVMELIPGGTIAAEARRRGRLPWPEVVEIGVVLATVLQWAHDRGVIHRDVKPENVLVDDRFGAIRDRIRLSDFGVAAIEGRTVTSEMWTLAHAAPEMVLEGAAPSVKTDLYGLASTLYELLDGEAPFVREDDEALAQVYARIRRGTVRDLRDKGVPHAVAAVVHLGLASDPDDRPDTVAELAALLADAGARALTAAPAPLTQGRPARPADDVDATVEQRPGIGSHRHPAARFPGSRVLVPMLATALVVLVAGVAFLVSRHHPSRKAPVASRTTTAVPPASPASSAAFPPPVVDSFDSDAQGWTTIQGADVAYQPTGGNPGGYVSATDVGRTITWFWEAPPRYRGDKSAYTGRSLRFDLKQSLTSNQFDDIDVWLLGADGTALIFDLPANPGRDWTPYTVPLDGGAGWHKVPPAGGNVPATIDDMRAVLSTLTYLRIRGEYASGTDVGGLDNVVFGV